MQKLNKQEVCQAAACLACVGVLWIRFDAGCLDAGKPHLYVLASNNDFYRWNQRYETPCLVWVLVGLLGLVLIVASIYEAVRAWSGAKSRLSIL
jgi:hypothetical protein